MPTLQFRRLRVHICHCKDHDCTQLASLGEGELRPECGTSMLSPVPGVGIVCTEADGSWWQWWRTVTMLWALLEGMQHVQQRVFILPKGVQMFRLQASIGRIFFIYICCIFMLQEWGNCNGSLGQMNCNWTHTSTSETPLDLMIVR